MTDQAPQTSQTPTAFQGTVWDGYNPDKDPTANDWGITYDAIERGVTDGIEKTENGASFASVRAPAWHKLGVTFDRPATAEELLVAANADYDVFQRPLFAGIEDDSPIGTQDISGKKAICRPGPNGGVQVLGIGSASYQVVTNRQAFLELGDAVLDLAEPVAATCGVLHNGRQAFMCWKLPKKILIGGVDAHELWMLFTHSHDQSLPLTAAVCELRTTCQNTQNYNLAHAKTKWTMKKTARAKARLQDIRTSLKLTYAYAEEFEKLAGALIKTPMKAQTFEQIITAEFGPREGASKTARTLWEEKRGALMGLFTAAPTQENIRGTAWAGVQAVGEFYDWETKVQRTAASAGMDPDGYRFWRSLDGEKSVTAPKRAMMSAVRRYADV